jgi:hypothetical protein
VSRPFYRGSRELSAFLSVDDDDSLWDMPAQFQPTVGAGNFDDMGPIQSHLQHWLYLTGQQVAGLFATAVIAPGPAGCWVGPLLNQIGNVNVSFLSVLPVVINTVAVSDSREDQNSGHVGIGIPALFQFGSGLAFGQAQTRGTVVTQGTAPFVGAGFGMALIGGSQIFVYPDRIFVPPGFFLQIQAGVVNAAFSVIARTVEPLTYHAPPLAR